MSGMEPDAKLHKRTAALEAAPSRWWAGEAEVVRTYFSNPRTREDDLHWLRLQAARELGTVERLLQALPHDLAQIETAVSRGSFEASTRSASTKRRGTTGSWPTSWSRSPGRDRTHKSCWRSRVASVNAGGTPTCRP